MDLTQWSKNKLDNFCQNDRNYWSWKGEFDEHTLRAKKTPEQKVDLLLKLVSPAMKDLITTLSDPPSFDDYKGWSGKLDVFARNLQNRAHQNKMDKGTTGGLNHNRPPLATDPGNATPVDRGDPMDLSAAQHGSSRLPEHEIQRRRTTGACTACGEHGHWKDAHRWSTTNPNPLPMPPRQTAPQRGGWNTDRGGRGHGGVPASLVEGPAISHSLMAPTLQPASPNRIAAPSSNYALLTTNTVTLSARYLRATLRPRRTLRVSPARVVVTIPAPRPCRQKGNPSPKSRWRVTTI